MSNRAYARSRGRSEAAIRQARNDGRLKGAIRRDGTLDPVKADTLLAGAAISGSRVGSDLAEARRRKLAAQCALLRMEVSSIEASLVTPQDAATIMTEHCAFIAGRLHRLSSTLAPEVAGLNVALASAAIQKAAHEALTDLSTTDTKAGLPAVVQDADQVGDMSSADLAALKATLQARRLEMKRHLLEGVVIEIVSVAAKMTVMLSAVRQRVLALHTRSAPYCLSANVEAVQLILQRDVDEAVEQMVCEYVAAQDLRPAANETSAQANTP